MLHAKNVPSRFWVEYMKTTTRDQQANTHRVGVCLILPKVMAHKAHNIPLPDSRNLEDQLQEKMEEQRQEEEAPPNSEIIKEPISIQSDDELEPDLSKILLSTPFVP
ncbi:hypothetical protein CsSME_00007793 [Camellia sinensis var. sinensis]